MPLGSDSGHGSPVGARSLVSRSLCPAMMYVVGTTESTELEDRRRELGIDRGGIWIGYQILAVLVGLIVGLVGLGVTIADLSVSVDREEIPAGAVVRVVEGRSGEDVYILGCPSPLRWLAGERVSYCSDESERILFVVNPIIAGIVAVCALIFMWARQKRRVARERYNQLLASGELLQYCVATMPQAYWMAVALIAPFVAFIVGSLGGELFRGADFDLDPRGIGSVVTFVSIVYFLVAVYSRRIGYLIAIDGTDVLWRAPAKTRRVPLDALVSVSVQHTRRVRGERVGTLTVLGEPELQVSIPNNKHQRRFELVCRAIGARSARFDFSEFAADAP